jgi:hypothetical protein
MHVRWAEASLPPVWLLVSLPSVWLDNAIDHRIAWLCRRAGSWEYARLLRLEELVCGRKGHQPRTDADGHWCKRCGLDLSDATPK